MRIIHKIQHGGEREIDVEQRRDGGERGGGMFICGVTNFQLLQKKARASQICIRTTTTSTTRQHYNTIRREDTRHDGGLGRWWGMGWRGVTEIHYVVPTSFISTRCRDGAPGVPALDQRALPFSPLRCESALRCVPGPKRRSINEYRG